MAKQRRKSEPIRAATMLNPTATAISSTKTKMPVHLFLLMILLFFLLAAGIAPVILAPSQCTHHNQNDDYIAHSAQYLSLIPELTELRTDDQLLLVTFLDAADDLCVDVERLRDGDDFLGMLG